MNKDIYIVISQTGTKFSRFLHIFNRTPYNHASGRPPAGASTGGTRTPSAPFTG